MRKITFRSHDCSHGPLGHAFKRRLSEIGACRSPAAPPPHPGTKHPQEPAAAMGGCLGGKLTEPADHVARRHVAGTLPNRRGSSGAGTMDRPRDILLTDIAVGLL